MRCHFTLCMLGSVRKDCIEKEGFKPGTKEWGGDGILKQSVWMPTVTCTRCSATADGPRDALCLSKSCQLLRKFRNKSCTTNLQKNRSLFKHQWQRARAVYMPATIECGQQARPLMSFGDNAMDVTWQNCPTLDFGTQLQRGGHFRSTGISICTV